MSFGSLGEILIISVAALILIGPKELPNVLRTCGRWFYHTQKYIHQFRSTFGTFLQEGQLEALKQEAEEKVLYTNIDPQSVIPIKSTQFDDPKLLKNSDDSHP